jgi:hypothetical protein
VIDFAFMSENKDMNNDSQNLVYKNSEVISGEEQIRIKSFIAVLNEFPEKVTSQLISEEFSVEEIVAKDIYTNMLNSYNEMKRKGLSSVEMRNWAKKNFSSGGPPFFKGLNIPTKKRSREQSVVEINIKGNNVRHNRDPVIDSSTCLEVSPISSLPASSPISLPPVLPTSSPASLSSSFSSSAYPPPPPISYLRKDGPRKKSKLISLRKKRKRIEEEKEDNRKEEEMVSIGDDISQEDDESTDDDPGVCIRGTSDEFEEEQECSSNSRESSAEEDISQSRFPSMLKEEKMTQAERKVLKSLRRYTSKAIRGPWNRVDVLNQMMEPKLRRKLESDAQAARTFYPAPKQFMKPFKGKTPNAASDTTWYRMQSDINILYRYIMWTLLKIEEDNTGLACRAVTTVVVPLIYHLLSRCQRERLNLRYSQKVVNALYDNDAEPMIRPDHMKRAKQLAAQQKDLQTIAGSFFGRGSRGRGRPFRSRGTFLGSHRGSRFIWAGRGGRSPQYQQQRQHQRAYHHQQQEKQQFPNKMQKN